MPSKVNHLSFSILNTMEMQLERDLVVEGEDPGNPQNAHCTQCGQSANTAANIEHSACPLEHIANLMAFYEMQGLSEG